MHLHFPPLGLTFFIIVYGINLYCVNAYPNYTDIYCKNLYKVKHYRGHTLYNLPDHQRRMLENNISDYFKAFGINLGFHTSLKA